jgi:hypothetical protein
MYWNKPLITVSWPSARDPVQESMHNGQHCLFWNPATRFNNVVTNQRLKDLCEWAMTGLQSQDPDSFLTDPKNYYDIANLVKLNIWIHDIRAQGIVKPWIMLDQGDGTWLAGTGDSRLRCLERIPEIQTVPAFVSTTQARAHLYQDLESVTTFDQFAKLCQAEPGQEFLFRLTDELAPYGIYWYEYNSERTRAVTPGETEAVYMFSSYLKKYPDVEITPEWFDTLRPWEYHKSSN